MYTTGFLGQLNTMATGLGNWVRAGALALGLSSMSAGCAENPTTIPPIDTPDPGDTTEPDTPEGNLRACGINPDTTGSVFRVVAEGEGIRLGTGPSVDGSFRWSLPGPLTILEGGNGQIRARARLRFDSEPVELASIDQDNPGGPALIMLSRTNARLQGRPLTDPNMTRANLTGTLATQFPGFADAGRVGFGAPVDVTVHYERDSGGRVSDCVVEMILGANARGTSGFGPTLEYGVLSFYAPRSDGREAMAEGDYRNEHLVILNGGVVAVLPVSGAWDEGICDSGCASVPGSSVSSVRMRLVRNTP